MPSESGNPPAKQVEKWERMQMILAELASAPAVSSVEEAWKMVNKAFRKIEVSVDLRAVGGDMVLRSLDRSKVDNYNGVKIYYEDYEKHVLLLGENGAVSILSKAYKTPMPTRIEVSIIKEELKCVLSKPGTNGKDVWGEEKLEQEA